MKKLYLIFISCLFMLGISTVKADTYIYPTSILDSDIDFYIENSEYISQLFDDLYYIYNDYKNILPYYFIKLNINGSIITMELYAINVSLGYTYGPHPTNSTSYTNINSWVRNILTGDVIGDYIVGSRPNQVSSVFYKSVDTSSGSFSTTSFNTSEWSLGYYGFDYSDYFYSNFNLLYMPSSSLDTLSININNKTYVFEENDIIYPISKYYNFNIINDPNSVTSTYQEVNLNDYPYVALTLKNYSSSSEFSSLFYVKGQLCLTPVYNYGMKEKKEFYTGYQVQGCTEYYNDFTPTRVYILDSDLQNHVVYYLKAYDTSKVNLIKVDTSIFDITYITSENEDNPSVVIEGRSYPTIPYSDLTDTATLSEEQGYVSGTVCAVGDLNCTREFSNLSWTDIFSSPLQALKSVWSAITAIFSLITAFILLLPPVMQNFLYLAFSIAIILGIIKIIL